MSRRFALVAIFGILVSSQSIFAQNSLIPALDSRAGATYTLYLNFGGFNFSGAWGGSGTPTNHSTPAYNSEGTAATFTAAEITNMRSIWSRTAEKYAAYNINVTTVDPAVAAGQAGTDASRQLYYEGRQRFMHSVIGGNGAWFGGGGGVSYISVAAGAGNTASNGGVGAGFKTNWAFSDNLGAGTPKFVAEAVAHEDGHALGLQHQAKWTAPGGTLVDAYDDGRINGVPNSASISPTMGVGYYTDRSAWRVGATNSNSAVTAQNDVKVIQANNGMTLVSDTGFVDTGIGHTLATATTIPVIGTTINSALSKGIITPLDSINPNPIGSNKYTVDVYKLVVGVGQTASLNVTLNSGRSTLVAGTADEGATLNATLRLLNASGGQIQISNGSTFTETIAASNLAAGTYFLEVSSAGGYTDSYGNTYFDMGSYFLSGTFVPVPEPTTIFAVSAAVMAVGGFVRRRMKGETVEVPLAA
jgi:hypothetical protein